MATWRTLIPILLTAGTLQAQPAGAACSKAITMVTEQWPPYVYGGEQRRGLDAELAEAIFAEAGCTLAVGPALPTVRRMYLFEKGRFDLMLAASDIPARRRFARFSAAYRYETVGLFALEKEAARFANIVSFDAVMQHQARLLVPTIGWYGPYYESNHEALKASGRLSTFGNMEQGLRMLAANRAELIMGDTVALQHQANEAGIAIRQLPFIVLHAPVHLMFSKASTTEADLASINAAIARLEKNGTLKAIRLRYAPR
jgi:polar amino acid transport system substrate-binding protein